MRSRVLLFALMGVAAVAASGETPSADLKCEPTRACAIELAREAGRGNYKAGKDKHNYVMGLLTIGDMQLADGDKAGLAATMAEILKVVPPGDEVGYRANLAALQARAGQLAEAGATVRSMRDAKRRDDAWMTVARALAMDGKWREALEFAKLKRRDKQDLAPGDRRNARARQDGAARLGERGGECPRTFRGGGMAFQGRTHRRQF